MQSKTNCYLAGTDKTKFKRKVIPGDQLYLDIKVVCLKRQIMKADAIASVNGDIACSTTISLFVECNEQERRNSFALPDYLSPVPVWNENRVLCTVHE